MNCYAYLHRLSRRALFPLALGALFAYALPAVAQGTFPSKPVKIVAPFSAGSGVDAIARIYARYMADDLKTPIIVENREGAGGMIGAGYAAKQPADGYTLLVATTPFVVGPISQSNTGYDPVKDFVAVGRMAINPLALAVNPRVPAKTMRELVAYAKANPGKLTYASSGPGTPSQLEMEDLKSRLGVDIREIPYKSNAQALTDTIAGTVDMYYTVQSTTLANVQGGKLKVLGVGALRRTQALPEAQTIEEAAGLAGYEAQVWYGFVVPAGTPADVVARLNAAIVRTTQKREVVEEVRKLGFEPSPSTATEFTRTISLEAEKTATLLKAAKK
jgi:tripartite-type tricarboxylate transporter receptor subunit TctC